MITHHWYSRTLRKKGRFYNFLWKKPVLTKYLIESIGYLRNQKTLELIFKILKMYFLRRLMKNLLHKKGG